MPQDFTLFILLKEKGIEIWKKKLNWLADKGGMVLMNTHPDYMNFSKRSCKSEEYPSEFYEQLLLYIKEKHNNKFWHVLPKEIARYWKMKEFRTTGQNV